jgi:hypothetical protein
MKQDSQLKLIKTCRDVLLLRVSAELILVVGCDSAGGIGPKPLDVVRVDADVLGRFTARVALMEVLSVGAKPICLTTALSVEREPAGIGIMKGIERELRFAQLSPRTPILDSSEKNVAVNQTGVGVTVIGTVSPRSLRVGRSKRGDRIIAIGTPHMGAEVLLGERKGKIANTRDVQALAKMPFIHEIIPVGSHGIMKEAHTIAQDSRFRFIPYENVNVDLVKSAGPSTVVLCTLPRSNAATLSYAIRKPVNIVGFLE